jgi:polar amino acid transport system substrate-binding protein
LLSSSLFALEKVTLQLHWLHQFQFAGYYMAKEKGFYEEAGLDVDIVQMAQKTDVIKDVVDSEAKYGIGRSSLLMEIVKGKELAVLAAIFQDSPSVLLSTNKHIKEPKDLKNKRVMVTLDELESTSILTTLASQNLTKEDIVLQAHSFKLRDLIEKKTDAMVCYLGNEPFT